MAYFLSSEIQSQQSIDNLSKGLIAYYPFNKNANDESGNGRNGTINGAKWTSAGKYGGAFDFNGYDNNNISFGDTKFLNTKKPFTISSWVFLRSFKNPFPTIFASKTNTNTWRIALSNNIEYSDLTFGANSGWTHSRVAISENILNKWINIVISYNGLGSSELSNYNVYVNGIKKEIKSVSAVYTFTDASSQIGNINYFSNHKFNGILDEIRIYNRVLNNTEINEIYDFERIGNFSYLLSGSQIAGTIGGKNAELLSKNVTLKQSCMIKGIEGNNDGFWIVDDKRGNIIKEYYKSNDKSAIGYTLKPGKYRVYPRLREKQKEASVTITLVNKEMNEIYDSERTGNFSYLLSGVQIAGFGLHNAELRSNALKLEQRCIIKGIVGNNDGFWIVDDERGNIIMEYYKSNDKSAIGYTLEPGIYRAYPRLREKQKEGSVTITLENK